MFCKKNNELTTVSSLFIKNAWVPAITVCDNNLLFYKQNPTFSKEEKSVGEYAILGSPFSVEWLNEIKSGLLATSIINNIDIVNVIDSTPTLNDIKKYKSILVFSDENFHDGNQLGNVVADYSDLGKGVVVSVFESSMSSLLGRWQSDLYDPLDPVSQQDGDELTLGDVLIPSHPIMENVTTFNGGTSSYRGIGEPLNHTTVIAKWSNNLPLIIERDFKNNGDSLSGKIVCLNFFPPSSRSREDFWNYSTDGYKIIANSLKYTGS